MTRSHRACNVQGLNNTTEWLVLIHTLITSCPFIKSTKGLNHCGRIGKYLQKLNVMICRSPRYLLAVSD